MIFLSHLFPLRLAHLPDEMIAGNNYYYLNVPNLNLYSSFFLSSFQTSPIFYEQFFKCFFGLASFPIPAEFYASTGFCLQPPRLDLNSFFDLFPDLTNFREEKIFAIVLAAQG
jgi:hypothetical protein